MTRKVDIKLPPVVEDDDWTKACFVAGAAA